MKKLFLAASCLILLTQAILAQDVRVYTNSPFISLNDKLQVILVLQGKHLDLNPEFPDINGFTKISEDAIVNMRSQGRETNYLQSYQPTSTGTFTVPSFPVKVGNRLHKTRSLIVKVEPPRPKGSNGYQITNADISLKMVCDQERVYPGQPIKTEIQLWIKASDRKKIRFDSLGIRGMTDRINWADFREMFQTIPPSNPENVELNGTDYEKHILYRTFLIPTDTGVFELENVGLNYDHLYVKLDPETGRNRGQYRIEYLQSDSKRIIVQALPKTRLPKAKTIGKFSLSYHLSKNQYETGESISLILEVQGKGNFQMAPRPELPDYDNLLSFDPVTSMKRDSGDTYSGIKDFRYEVIAAYAGEYDLGPITFYYFDPEKRAYDSASIESIPIIVSGDPIPQLLEVNALDKFYRKALKTADDKPPFGSSYLTWIIGGITVFSFLVILWGMMRKEDERKKRRKRSKWE